MSAPHSTDREWVFLEVHEPGPGLCAAAVVFLLFVVMLTYKAVLR